MIRSISFGLTIAAVFAFTTAANAQGPGVFDGGGVIDGGGVLDARASSGVIDGGGVFDGGGVIDFDDQGSYGGLRYNAGINNGYYNTNTNGNFNYNASPYYYNSNGYNNNGVYYNGYNGSVRTYNYTRVRPFRRFFFGR